MIARSAIWSSGADARGPPFSARRDEGQDSLGLRNQMAGHPRLQGLEWPELDRRAAVLALELPCSGDEAVGQTRNEAWG